MFEQRNKYAYESRHKRRHSTIDGNDMNRSFSDWTSVNMYRTTSSDMSSRSPQKPKAFVVPGYQGYVPKKDADTEYGKTLSRVSRRCFVKEDKIRGSTQFHKTSG